MIKQKVPVTRLFSTIEITGEEKKYLVVPPHGELSKPLADYFPGCTIDQWFAHNEAWRKQRMRWRWGNNCMITGRCPIEVHEIDAKGMGSRACALVPTNMILVSPYCHRLLQSRTWKVVRFDLLAWPFDRSGIQIIDDEGRLISCWYNLNAYEREKRREHC